MEKAIVAIIFIILGLGAVSALVGKSVGASAVRENAERYAVRYGSRIEGMRTPIAECMGVDSDDNGYVTCSVRDGDRDLGIARPRQIECAANVFFEFNTGCREYRLRTLDVRAGEVGQ